MTENEPFAGFGFPERLHFLVDSYYAAKLRHLASCTIIIIERLIVDNRRQKSFRVRRGRRQ
jgi:hypothetical protein